MNTRQRCLLVNMNRVLIFTLSLTGLLMDGFQPSDLPCAAALLVWLWLPHCTRMETSLLHRIGGLRNDTGASKLSSGI